MREFEKYRAEHPLKFPHKEKDPFGWFMIPFEGREIAVQWDDSDETWEHLSASLSNRTPNWREMCFLKDLFFGDKVAVQFHPLKKDYVNLAQNCLHLWHYKKGDLPTPPRIMV